ncbi:MAG: hypothetical protein ACTHJN_03055 [Ginsengibacter sp.]
MTTTQKEFTLNQFKLNKKVIVRFDSGKGKVLGIKAYQQTTLSTDSTFPTTTMDSQSLL